MSKKLFTTLLLAGLLVLNIAAKGSSDALVIADFNKGNQNALGGYFNKYERNPSKATVGLTTSVFNGNDGKSLKIKSTKKEEGFCGAWIHLFDFRADDKKFLDASAYEYLSFSVKGAKGGETFSVKLADQRLIEIEDSAKVGAITDFLHGGITREWQEVLVPLSRLGNIDKSKLGGITFDFDTPGNYTVYIDDIVLKKTKEASTSLESGAMDEASTVIASQQRAIPSRTMWAWTVYEILENKNNEQDNIFEVCERENIDRIWLQLPLRYEPNIDLAADYREIQPDKFKISLQHRNKLRKFIREASARGIKIEGLDGYPEFAQKPYHFIPLAIVDAVIDYNKRVKPEERFVGIHFDNEPYLIIGWHDKERREQILKDFLELNVECQRRIRENSDMEFGVDVPFRWNAPDPSPILDYAQEAGKKRIYIGLEVFRYEPTEVYFPFGLTHEEFRKALQTDADRFGYLSRINGFRTQLIDDGVNIHVGIEIPQNPDDAMQEKINDTLAEISRYLGVNRRQNLSARDYKKVAMYAQKEINQNPEWRDYGFIDIVDRERLELYPGFKAVSIMLGKTTFADESYSEFKEQLDTAESELINFTSFCGTAIHYYKVLDEKFQEKQAE